MRISTQWLRELLPGLTLSSEEIAQVLTLHSYETNVVERRQIDPLVRVVRVEKIEPHPNADRLRLATVSDGEVETQVVCGAPNIAVGAVVPYSPPGTTVLDEAGKPWVLKQTKIRGVESPGMLNSPRELGLGSSHAGILILPADTPLGSSLAEHIPNDDILEADITRNRASDSLGHLGVARELGSLLKLPVKEPMVLSPLPTELPDWSVAVAEPEAVSRYVGGVVSGLVIAPSPLWLQARLFAVGLRPINNVVDCTNYVLWEFGYPTHAFDTARLPSRDIGVRFAQAAEKLTTLDGEARTLNPEALLITSGDQPVALAGIMGGSGAEISATTNEVFLEVAHFSPHSIQRTVQSQGLRTEAAARWLKGIDPNLADAVMGRLLYLLITVAGGNVAGVVDLYPVPRVVEPIAFRPERVVAVAGQAYSLEQILDALQAIYCTVDSKKIPWQVTPPNWRLDLTQEFELVEEIIRLVGLESIPGTTIMPAEPVVLPAAIRWRELLRDVLVKWGLHETYNYSFEIAEWASVTAREQTPLTLLNPVAPERKYLRRSLLPGLLSTLARNKGEFRVLQFFEIGAVYYGGSDGVVAGVHEERQLAGVITGIENNQTKAAMLVEHIMTLLGITDIQMRPATQQPWSAAAQEIIHGGIVVGYVGSLESLTVAPFKGVDTIAAFQLNLDTLCELATADAPTEFPVEGSRAVYAPFSKYPPVFRDVAVLVAPDLTIEAVQQVIEQAGGDLVVDVDLFDVYQPPVTDGEPIVSLAFHIKYQSAHKTLTDDEVAARHNEIVVALKTALGAQIRE